MKYKVGDQVKITIKHLPHLRNKKGILGRKGKSHLKFLSESYGFLYEVFVDGESFYLFDTEFQKIESNITEDDKFLRLFE